MKLVRMKPGHGDQLLAEGDPELAEEEAELIEAFRRQLDQGMWAAVPTRESGWTARSDDGPRLLRGAQGRRARDLLSAGGGRMSTDRTRQGARVSAVSIVVVSIVGVGLFAVAFGPDAAKLVRRRRPRRAVSPAAAP